MCLTARGGSSLTRVSGHGGSSLTRVSGRGKYGAEALRQPAVHRLLDDVVALNVVVVERRRGEHDVCVGHEHVEEDDHEPELTRQHQQTLLARAVTEQPQQLLQQIATCVSASCISLSTRAQRRYQLD